MILSIFDIHFQHQSNFFYLMYSQGASHSFQVFFSDWVFSKNQNIKNFYSLTQISQNHYFILPFWEKYSESNQIFLVNLYLTEQNDNKQQIIFLYNFDFWVWFWKRYCQTQIWVLMVENQYNSWICSIFLFGICLISKI